MFVDDGLLRAGGGSSHHAGEHARRAAAHLAGEALSSQMFGDFAAAESLHEAAAQARDRHQRTLLFSGRALGSVGTKARVAADRFTAMDEDSAVRVRAVRCASAT